MRAARPVKLPQTAKPEEAEMTAATRPEFRSVSEPTLYVAFELSAKHWKLAMTSGVGIEPWIRTVPAGDLRAIARVTREGRRRFQLPETALVLSC